MKICHANRYCLINKPIKFMKKKQVFCSSFLNYRKKALLVMKCLSLFLVLFSFYSFTDLYSQNTKLKINLKEASLIDMIKDIEKQSEFIFIYNDEILPELKKVKGDIQFKNRSIQRVLDRVLDADKLMYSINDRQVILNKKAEYNSPVNVQQNVIKGVVVDNNGVPLGGVNVLKEGTSTGTQTDFDGNYTINAEKGDQLKFSYVGMQTVTITVGDNSTVNVTMLEDTENLDQVVITAFGIKRDKKSLGYAVSKISSEDITIAGVSTNPVAALYGKAAGVGITTSGAGPTGAVDIKIRGAASLAGGNVRPLFVVDGTPIFDEPSNFSQRGYDPLNSFDYGSGINDINAEDIESIEILKGAKASVLYGNLGANGVVLITTKKGRQTRGLGVTLSTQYTFEKPVSFIEFQNQFGSGVNEYDLSFDDDGNRVSNSTRFNFGPRFNGDPIQFFDGSTQPYQAYPDNFIDLFRTGSNEVTTVAVSGGGELGSMRFSYTNQDYQGILPNHYQKKHVFNLGSVTNVSDFTTIEVNQSLNLVKTNNRYPNINGIVAWGINRDYDFNKLLGLYKNDDGSRLNTEDLGLPNSVLNLFNYLWEQQENSDLDERFHYIGSVRGTFNFTDNASLMLSAGLDYTDVDFTTRNPPIRFDPEVTGGRYAYRRNRTMVENYRGIFNYDTNFLDDRLNVFAFIGGEYRRVKRKNIGVSSYGNFAQPDLWSIDNSTGDWPGFNQRGRVRSHGYNSLVEYGLFGSLTFEWDNQLYVEFQGRNDWTSTLPPDNNSFFYPGIGVHWNFTNAFDIPFMEFGKLRASWADVGRGAGSLQPYFTYEAYSSNPLAGSNAVLVNAPGDLFSGTIKPERKREFEIGFDARFFKNSRLETNFSFYTANVYNQIMGLSIPNPSGFPRIRVNAGDVKQWGYELLVKAAIIANEKLRWDVAFTTANQFSEVKDLANGITRYSTGAVGNSLIEYAEVGKPIGELHMFDFLTDGNGNRVVDNSGGYVLDKSDFKAVANSRPDFIGGLTSDLFFKGFNFHVGLDYSFGSTIFSRSNFYLLGNGISEQSLAFRDQANGGLAYYINADGNRIAWQHDQAAPADSSDGLVYHDGVINPGVVNVGDADNPVYVENTTILSAQQYYASYINDLGTDYRPDHLQKNDYLKLREIALSYTIPKKIVNKAGLEKLTFSVTGRNLFYLYKSVPNIDSESLLGSGSFVENSFFPAIQSFGFGLNASF